MVIKMRKFFWYKSPRFLWPPMHLITITPRMFMSTNRNYGKSRFSATAALAINALNKMNRYFASISTLAVTYL